MSKSTEWWHRVKDYSVKHNITFEEAKNLGAGGKKYRIPKKSFTLGDKVVKTKHVCVSCGKEAEKIGQQKCSSCRQDIIKKVVVDKC